MMTEAMMLGSRHRCSPAAQGGPQLAGCASQENLHVVGDCLKEAPGLGCLFEQAALSRIGTSLLNSY